ncbi:MAG TPA: SOS response-associated peptidase [Paludibacter sp.]|nr:SOS response-associated peptidase [Paludibacter sp.]
MCFTVAILRNNTLLTLEKYYDSLPDDWEKQNDLPEFTDYYFVSGFSAPELPVIKEDGIFMYQWGLIPSWIKTEKDATEIRTKTLNALGETVFEKPSFRKSIQSQRCILPVTGFFEYRDVNGSKFPYFIHPTESESFFIGAIYDKWINVETEEINNTFSIVTTTANTLMTKIHNLKKRMPLIMNDNEVYKWMDTKTDAEHIKKLIKPYDDSKMAAHTISRIANNARLNRNVPEIINEVIYPEVDASTQLTLF